MKKLTRRIIALTMSAALCAGCTGLAFAENTKDETVYVFSGADGSVSKIVVSDWLKNEDGDAALEDASDLKDIENVKGEETFTADGTSLVWDANGNDIYYRGTADKDLPVTLSVRYQLDGEDIEAKDLVGKSGHVTVRFDYQNNQYELRDVKGNQEKIYVPFAVVTGMVLDNDVFRNVEVTNGKLVNDGTRTAVVGLALPGMQENLGLDADTLTIPTYVEISADVTDFSMGMTMTLMTNQVFQSLEEKELTSPEDLTDAVNQLTDAVSQLLDGSTALHDGLVSLQESAGDLVDGVNALSDGAAALHDGADQLNAGAAELNNGLGTLVSNNDSLTDGAAQVFNTLLATATSQLKAAGVDVPALTIENYNEIVGGLCDSLSEESVTALARQQVAAQVEKNRDLITKKVTEAVQAEVEPKVEEAVRATVTEQVTEAVKAQVSEQVIAAATNMTADQYAAAVKASQLTQEQIDAVNAAIDEQMNSNAVQATISGQVSSQMNTQTVKNSTASALNEQMKSEDVQNLIAQKVQEQVDALIDQNMQSDAVQEKLAAAAESRAPLETLKTSLDSYNTFYTGLVAYTEGVSSASQGAGQLLAGTSDLCTGAAQLNDGAAQLKDAMPALTDGVNQLVDGAQQLTDGIRQFADEGIQKMADLVNGDLDTLLARINATAAVSRDYHTFSGKTAQMDGQVKFIYRTEEVK